MESEQTGLALSLPLSPKHVSNSPVEFAHQYLYPSLEARYTVSFRLDYVLFTAASDSEDFGPALAESIPPSGQEARPSAAYSEHMDVLSRATDSSQSIGPMSPTSRSLRNSTSISLEAQIRGLHGGSYHFSVIWIMRSPDLGNSHSPPTLLTRQLLISPT